MGKKDRYWNRRKKDGKKSACDKNKTSANSASTMIEVKVDAKGIANDIQGTAERIQADKNDILVDGTKLTDDKENGNNSCEDSTASEPSSNGKILFMSGEGIKKNIDEIETVMTRMGFGKQRLGMASTQNPVGTNSVLEQDVHLGKFLKFIYRNFFANETRVIRLNEENIERIWNIFYSASANSKQDNKTKTNQVLKVLKEVRCTKLSQKELEYFSSVAAKIKKYLDKELELMLIEKRGDISSSDKEPKTSIENAEFQEKTAANHGTVDVDNNTAIKKNKHKESELMLTEKRGDTSSSDKEPKTSIENSELHEIKTENHENTVVDTTIAIKKYKHKESELIITEKKEYTSSEKVPKTSILNTERNKKTTAIASKVVDSYESYDKQKEKVIQLGKNDNINFCYETDDNMHISAGNDGHSYTLEEKDITFNFNDENIQVSFTGKYITISTPDNEFDIYFRKIDPVNLISEATQTDNV